MEKNKITDAIISEVYFAEDNIKEDVERIKSNIEFWGWVLTQFDNISGYGSLFPDNMRYVFAQSRKLIQTYINEVKDKIINLEELPDLSEKIIKTGKDFQNSVSTDYGSQSGIYIAITVGNYILDQMEQIVNYRKTNNTELYDAIMGKINSERDNIS